jgi:hypothetical protein
VSTDPERGYEVGYGKPPVAARFQKGTSGNPSGRPKKILESLDAGSVVQSIDSEEIVVTDNGKRKRLTKAEIIFRQTFAKATRGDLQMARLLVAMAAKYFGPEIEAAPETEFIIETEAAQNFGREPR